MRTMRIVVALFAVLAATSIVARADLVLVGGSPTSAFVDLGATGFGDAPRLLTLQTTGIESGGVTPVNVVNGDAISGANKSSTPTLTTLGWTSGAQVGIGLDTNQTGGTGITLDTLVLTIYNGTTSVGSFSLASPVNFSQADLRLQQGNGNSVFNFALTPAEQATFDTILATPGSGGFFAGLSSSLGCGSSPPAGCMPSNDGADSYLGFAQRNAIPDGGMTLMLLGGSLVGLATLRRRFRA